MSPATLLSAPPSVSRAPAPPFRWPVRWADRQLLLERQHARLEALLKDLIDDRGPGAALQGGDVDAPVPGAAGGPALRELGDRRLLRQLRLHLRLEERWLSARGCLCPGHRAQHRLAAEEARRGLDRAGGEPAARLALLIALRTWFLQHRDGPDALAYGRAAAAE